MNDTLAVFLILIFGAILVFAEFLALQKLHLVEQRNTNIGKNPYYVREFCGEGNSYELTEESDPVKAVSQKINYCMSNGPKCDFVKKMREEMNIDEARSYISDEALRDYLEFYHEYTTKCGYSWAGGNPGVWPDPNVPSTGTNPRDPNYINGPNDDFLIDLYGLCKVRFDEEDSVCANLKDVCGNACS